jgi:SHS2 domain-containing protein
MYETFEHTADLGLRIRAADLDALFAEAAQALFSVIVEDIQAIAPRQKFEVRLQGDEREYLLFDWLNWLLYEFDTKHFVCGKFEVHAEPSPMVPTGLYAKVWGEPLDPARHGLGHEVKAITYHGLKVEQTSDGWLAEVIVDI